MSTQAPEQRENPESQVVPQTPAEHTALPLVTAGQILPQAPQFMASVLAFTHCVPQATKGALHEKLQPVASQTGTAFAGALHTVPHLPQFEVSLPRSTQEPLQAESVPQSLAQSPDLHSMPASHTVAQLPQCWPLDCVSTHWPLQSV